MPMIVFIRFLVMLFGGGAFTIDLDLVLNEWMVVLFKGCIDGDSFGFIFSFFL